MEQILSAEFKLELLRIWEESGDEEFEACTSMLAHNLNTATGQELGGPVTLAQFEDLQTGDFLDDFLRDILVEWQEEEPETVELYWPSGEFEKILDLFDPIVDQGSQLGEKDEDPEHLPDVYKG
ncbi:hypothetical protein HN876_00565 [archaeon]|jgi:hypothetical protein|nr:hypothetical protein [archaeon]MBT6606438.1 hypothetical protein [archaeon]MBT7251393.1 hypothetical protein [archaeon]